MRHGVLGALYEVGGEIRLLGTSRGRVWVQSGPQKQAEAGRW